MKATGFSWFHLPVTLVLLTSYWYLQVNGDCAKAKCTFSDDDGQCGASCRCYSDPEYPEHPTTGVCAPHYETAEPSQQPYQSSGQGGHYGARAGFEGVGALAEGAMGATQQRPFPPGAMQSGRAQAPQSPASPNSSPNSLSPQPATKHPGTTSVNKASLPPKPASAQQFPPKRAPFPPSLSSRPARPPMRRPGFRSFRRG
uniref:Putative mannosyl-oligosaccharide 12-alpha-mannosidase ic n=1 Tax=Amblyomma americanum TaxID=6943 RepID=A0A0C9S560_AMBAM